jgi:hypothetical protein
MCSDLEYGMQEEGVLNEFWICLLPAEKKERLECLSEYRTT